MSMFLWVVNGKAFAKIVQNDEAARMKDTLSNEGVSCRIDNWNF